MLQFVDLCVLGTIHITHGIHDTGTSSKALIMPDACDLQKLESLFLIPTPSEEDETTKPHAYTRCVSNDPFHYGNGKGKSDPPRS